MNGHLLSTNFCGIQCVNSFFLASGPVAGSYDMCARAIKAGFGGLMFKTIASYVPVEVSPRLTTGRNQFGKILMLRI